MSKYNIFILMRAIFGKQIALEDIVDGIDEVLLKAFDLLTERERTVLKLRFGLEDGQTTSLAKAEEVLCVSRERIRQIEVKALRKLRHPARANIFRSFCSLPLIPISPIVNCPRCSSECKPCFYVSGIITHLCPICHRNYDSNGKTVRIMGVLIEG